MSQFQTLVLILKIRGIGLLEVSSMGGSRTSMIVIATVTKTNDFYDVRA